ncbi:hypothetical protein F4809DRAFT_611103 [Biscogniauxia mediterranea]|nr:hypothetical protein F4809DRAFT_611103 [Biscogniauxia mediterranea]
MATNKRREINTAEPPSQPISAFALRKRLLAERSPVTTTPEDLPGETKSSVGNPAEEEARSSSSTPRRLRKARAVQQPSRGEDIPLNNPTEPPPKSRLAEEPNISSHESPAASRSPSPPLVKAEAPVETPIVQLSSFRPSRSNYQQKKGGKVLIKLTDGERLVVLGSYGVRVDSGEVTIVGATLRSSKDVYWVNAPHCHALPVIRCSKDAALELSPHPGADSLRQVGELSPQFRRLWNETSDSSFQILYSSGDGPKRASLQALVSPPEWNREIAKLLTQSNTKPLSVMITGPKSSGKSTFGKLLANRLVTNPSSSPTRRESRAVAILDLDPGQPEYCVAGQIALVLLTEPVLEPSFCHPLPASGFRIIRSHALASVSPASDPELYVEAAIDLVTHYRNILGSCPLIINTPGWIQGTGLELLTSLIIDIRPSSVIYMSQAGPFETVESLGEACKTNGFSTLPSQMAQYVSRTASQLRSMQTQSYFHAESRSSNSDNYKLQWLTKPLTTVPPWQVSYKGEDRGIFGIMCYDYQTTPDLLADAVNGTILAAVEVENVKAFRGLENQNRKIKDSGNSNTADSNMELDDDQSKQATLPSLSRLQGDITTVTPEGIPYIETSRGTTLDPRYSQSLGLVLVRGIDVANGFLQILTPISPEKIREVSTRGGQIVLVSGKFDPPSWAYTEDLYHRSHARGGDNSAAPNDVMDIDQSGMNDSSSEDTDEDNDLGKSTTETGPTPWIEVLPGNRKRGAGSKVLRVRRDLGRMGNAHD